MPKFYDMLKPKGSILVLNITWLPFEDKIAGASEKLVLKYNPDWSGVRETIHQIGIPDCYHKKFELVHHEEFTLKIPFTRESWNGRIKVCRGIGASLSGKELSMWEQEHRKLLEYIAPNEFDILHYGAIAELKGIKFRHVWQSDRSGCQKGQLFLCTDLCSGNMPLKRRMGRAARVDKDVLLLDCWKIASAHQYLQKGQGSI